MKNNYLVMGIISINTYNKNLAELPVNLSLNLRYPHFFTQP